MKPKPELMRYIKGEIISSGLRAKISHPGEKLRSRMETIESYVKDKRIIHLGFADHLPLIRKKLEKNLWLHKRLCNVTDRCLGIDTNKEAVQYIKDSFHYDDVLCCDILKHKIPQDKWDYLVAGEILEHIDNPVEFIKRIRLTYKNDIERIIITVPNALFYQNFLRGIWGVEGINSDHTYWFTPYTLLRVAHKAGLQIESLQLCNGFRLKSRMILQKTLSWLFPIMRDNIVLVCRLNRK